MDFGLAKMSSATIVTKAGMTLGTVGYMSPEQSKGEEVDHRTDIWSLGVVFYEMIAGVRPFKGEYETALVYYILNVDPEPLTGLRTGVPMDLEKIINFFEKDAVYHNIPIAPSKGKEAIRATLAGFLDPDGAAKFVVNALACDGSTVLTERVDYLTIGGKQVSLPVMGAFEVTDDGKISAWRDYFDMGDFTGA